MFEDIGYEIYQEDCLEVLNDLISLGIKVDLTVTSPPYDDLRNYEESLIWNFDVFKQVANRLNHVGTIYRTALNDMNAFGEDTNPYAIRLAAQNIAQNNLRLEDYDLQLALLYDAFTKMEKVTSVNIKNTKTRVIKPLYLNQDNKIIRMD